MIGNIEFGLPQLDILRLEGFIVNHINYNIF
jgi:hypothetical protein